MATKLGKMVADFSTTLATAIAIGGTGFTLQSIVDDDGNNIPDGYYYFTIDGNNSSKEHVYCVISGATVTSVLSVSRQGVTASGVVRAHRVGATVVITDFAHIMRMNNLFLGVDRLDASTPLRYDGTATISNANDLATKAYVDGVAIAGAPDSSTTVKGIVKMSVAPASATSPIAVGDNDNRVSPVSLASLTADIVAAFAGTGTPSGANKFVTADTNALNELLSNKSTTTTLGTSDTLYPSQNAVKTYVDNQTIIWKTGVTTKTDTDGNGAQTIAHGLGKTPKFIRITALVNESASTQTTTSIGTYNGTTVACAYLIGQNTENGTNAGTHGNDSTNIVHIIRNKVGSVASYVAVPTFNSTNIVLTWTVSGTMAGVAIQILWEAFA